MLSQHPQFLHFIAAAAATTVGPSSKHSSRILCRILLCFVDLRDCTNGTVSSHDVSKTANIYSLITEKSFIWLN